MKLIPPSPGQTPQNGFYRRLLILLRLCPQRFDRFRGVRVRPAEDGLCLLLSFADLLLPALDRLLRQPFFFRGSLGFSVLQQLLRLALSLLLKGFSLLLRLPDPFQRFLCHDLTTCSAARVFHAETTIFLLDYFDFYEIGTAFIVQDPGLEFKHNSVRESLSLPRKAL